MISIHRVSIPPAAWRISVEEGVCDETRRDRNIRMSAVTLFQVTDVTVRTRAPRSSCMHEPSDIKVEDTVIMSDRRQVDRARAVRWKMNQ